MSIKRAALSGMIWTFSQQISVQLINFIVQIILARILLPEIFGLIAMLSIFIAVGQTLMDSGMTSSLIRSKEIDQIDYSTVFFTNILISVLVYVIIFVSAPAIGHFYNQPVLVDVLRVFSLTFIIKSFVAVHTTKMTKELDFKLQMKLQIPSTIGGAVIGIILAMKGYGIWSLVWLNLSQSIIFTLHNWFSGYWMPTLVFNYEKFKSHFSFGYKITLSSLIDTVYNNAYNIIIAKFFSPSIVGYYTQADSLRLFPVSQLSLVLSKVTYPIFSNIKDDVKLKEAYRLTMLLILFIVIPVMLVLMIVAEPLFGFLYGEKWLPAVPYFTILCIASIVRPIGTYNLNILKVKGRTDILLKLELIKKVIGIATLVIFLPFGVIALVWSLSITSFLFAFLNGYYCGKLINYNVREQIKDFCKLMLIGLIPGAITFLIHLFFIDKHLSSKFLIIVLDTTIFTSLYFFITYFFNRSILMEFKSLIRR